MFIMGQTHLGLFSSITLGLIVFMITIPLSAERAEADNIVGTQGRDNIKGTDVADEIQGLAGNDNIRGGDGSDVIKAGEGDDMVSGQKGDDDLFGEHGQDRIYGGPGSDRLYGGEGDDRLSGGAEDDILRGDNGADIFECGTGNDVVVDYSIEEGDVLGNNCESVFTGPTAFWKFDDGSGDTATDSSGNGNTGRLVNGPEWLDSSSCAIQSGKSCLRFDGIDDYVNVQRSPSIEPPNAITISLWVNATGDRSAIIDKSYTSHVPPFYSYNIQLEPYLPDNTKAEVVYCLTTQDSISCMGENETEVLIDKNKWQFITVVYDGSEMKEYVNGVLKQSIPKSGPISYYDTPLVIGRFNNNVFDVFLDGDLDQIRIHDHALSPSEIHQLYEEAS